MFDETKSAAVLLLVAPKVGLLPPMTVAELQRVPGVDGARSYAEELLRSILRDYGTTWGSHLSLGKAQELVNAEIATKYPELSAEAANGLARLWSYTVK